jgi:hypothetical protein
MAVTEQQRQEALQAWNAAAVASYEAKEKYGRNSKEFRAAHAKAEKLGERHRKLEDQAEPERVTAREAEAKKAATADKARVTRQQGKDTVDKWHRDYARSGFAPPVPAGYEQHGGTIRKAKGKLSIGW